MRLPTINHGLAVISDNNSFAVNHLNNKRILKKRVLSVNCGAVTLMHQASYAAFPLIPPPCSVLNFIAKAIRLIELLKKLDKRKEEA
jgi:hypothetical protein